MKKISYLMLLLSVMLWSCSKDTIQEPDDKKPDTEKPVALKNMVTGTLVVAASGTVGITGGKIKVTTAGLPVNGLELDIPDSSFTTAQSFKISYSEIKSHQLGANINPVSPLIKITTDAGYSQQIMRITIPVSYPAGSIPIGFYYDELTGKLEGIPFESITANSITLLTRHLMPPSKLKSGIAEKSAQAESGANILVSSISESVLNAQPVIASGFKPGVDDWEFVNYGSYIASGGHCAGQNMAAMWYYFEKKPAEGKLFERFSDTPNFWQDNAIGYRFCSVVHADLQWDGNVATLFEKYIDKNQELDRLKLMTIAATMLVTGEPQGIGIYRQTGTKPNGTPKYGGHDLICYQVSVNSGKLYISDPNTPAAGQEIIFTNNRFQPYMAKLNGNDASNPYPFVTYYAKTAYIEWDKIGKRWDEVLNKTIGTVAPNTFPAYTMEIKGTTVKMKEGLALAKDTLTVFVVCPTSEVGYDVNGKRLIGANVFDKDGKYIDIGTNKYTSTTILKPGKNKLGYYIHGWRSNSKDPDGKYYDKFIDFKWFNVYYMPLTIEPNPLAGEPNTEYKFTARSKGAAPASAKYIWNFGDGSAPFTAINDSTAKHKFVAEGNFKIKVELFDNANNTKIADTTSTVSIKVKKLVPLIDSLGTRHYTKNFTGLFSWGCTEMLGSTTIYIYGKNWSVSSDKTVVKIDGVVVPIKNLISTDGKYEVNKTQIAIDIPKNKKGKVLIVVESDGEVSVAKEYYVGIPKDVLQKLPLYLFSNSFNYNYNDRTSGKITFSGCSDWFYKSTNQIESAVWNGNILTIQGAINWGAGVTPTRQKLVCEFSDDGTILKNIQMDMTSLNVEIRYSVKLDAVVSYEPTYNQLIFIKSKIPVSDYTFTSGKFTWTSPIVSVAINGISESQSSWSNEIRVTFLLKNQ